MKSKKTIKLIIKFEHRTYYFLTGIKINICVIYNHHNNFVYVNNFMCDWMHHPLTYAIDSIMTSNESDIDGKTLEIENITHMFQHELIKYTLNEIVMGCDEDEDIECRTLINLVESYGREMLEHFVDFYEIDEGE